MITSDNWYFAMTTEKALRYAKEHLNQKKEELKIRLSTIEKLNKNEKRVLEDELKRYMGESQRVEEMLETGFIEEDSKDG